MTLIEDVLSGSVTLAPEGRGRFRAVAELSSWPGIVHGGGLVALLDAAADRLIPASRARVIEGRLTSSVPTEDDLCLEASASDGAVSVSVVERGTPLTSVTVRSLDATTAASVQTQACSDGSDAPLLPMSERCLACGAANPLSLGVRLRFDHTGVWARLVPPPAWWTHDGALHPAVAAVLLDEGAWWLGALTMREGGLTNRIAVTLTGALLPAGEALIVAGRFENVQPMDRRRTFLRTIASLRTEAGKLLATAVIVFRGGPDYSSRQLPYLRARSTPAVFARMFPNHCG
jgi:hypothetical protein